MSARDLTGLPILISGASSGIGRATAVACAKAGMPVALAARRADRLDEVCKVISAQGGEARAVVCDVRDVDACARAVETTIDWFGSIYAVFANAGYGLERSVLQTSDAELRAIFETNVFGSLNLIRPAVAQMLSAGRGHVLWCSSCLSKVGTPWHGAYSASKAVQDHLGRAMRCELHRSGVCVSTVHPIGTRTEFFEEVSRRGGGQRLRSNRPMQPPEMVAKAIVRCLRRPRGEVWTSKTMRLMLGLAVVAPGLADRALRRAMRDPVEPQPRP